MLRHCTESGSRIEEEGKKGQRAAKRVSKDKATARRLGAETTARTTASVSLATPASSPEPHVASWQLGDTTADAVNPNATCAEPTRPVDESYNPSGPLPSTSLREAGLDRVMSSARSWMPRKQPRS